MVESDLNADISHVCRQLGFRWRRFEVPSAHGYPDAWLGAPAGNPRFAWIECKILARPNAMPEYRQGQLAWALEADKYGERSITIAAAADGFYRLWNTPDVALAKAFSQVVMPTPFLMTSDLPTAVRRALGIE